MRKIKLIVAVFVFSALLVVVGLIGNMETHYKLDGIVTYASENIVTVEDFAGNVWEIESAEFHVGDVVEMTMFDCGGSVENDIVVEIDMK